MEIPWLDKPSPFVLHVGMHSFGVLLVHLGYKYYNHTYLYPHAILLLSIVQYVVSTPCSAQSSGSAVKQGQLESNTSGAKAHVVDRSQFSEPKLGELNDSGNCDMSTLPLGVVLLDAIMLAVEAGGVGPGLMFTVPRNGTLRWTFSPLVPDCLCTMGRSCRIVSAASMQSRSLFSAPISCILSCVFSARSLSCSFSVS